MYFSIHRDDGSLTFEDFLRIDQSSFPHQPLNRQQFENNRSHPVWLVYPDHEDCPVAYMIIKESGTELRLSRIAVLREYRKQGIATLLMNTLFNYAREGEKSAIVLSVQTDNLPAIRLYQKYGFKENGRQAQLVFSLKEIENHCLGMAAVTTAATVNEGTVYWIDFYDKDQVVGCCRLDISFPGCNQFDLIQAEELFERAILALKPYLGQGQNELLLVTGQQHLIQLCIARGHRLNYELMEMKAIL